MQPQIIELHGNHYGPGLGYRSDETLRILGGVYPMQEEELAAQGGEERLSLVREGEGYEPA